MEMVAAARLRRAEQRIEALRPYADAIRRMTRQAARGRRDLPRLPILQEHEQVARVGLLLVAGDRGLAGAFNSNVVRAGVAAGREHEREGHRAVLLRLRAAPGLIDHLPRPEPGRKLHGFTDRPAYADARRIAERLIAAYVDGERRPGGDLLQPLRLAAVPGRDPRDAAAAAAGDAAARTARRATMKRMARIRLRALGQPGRWSSTSLIPSRSWGGWCPTTSRSRSTERCSSRPRPSTARG